MTAFPEKLLRRSVLLLMLMLILPVAGAFAATAPLVSILGTVTAGISTPLRIATDQFGNFYLTDPRGGGVLKYNASGSLVATVPVKTPQGIAVTQGGDLVVGQGSFVSVLDSTGKEKFKLGKGAGQLKMANGITIDAAGFIYVVDSLDNCVQVFTGSGAPVNIGNAAAGKPANSFGTAGNQPGQFSTPTGITYEKSSNQLAVVDTLNGRVQFFDVSGTFQKSIGSSGSGPLKFTSPEAVAFEYTKDAKPALARMYVVDSFQSDVQVIDPTGTGAWLGFIGSYGTTAGRLVVPSDALFDVLGNRLLVVNGVGNLTVYGINGGSTPIADTTPPSLTVTTPPTVTGSSSVTIGGTVEAGATVTIMTDTAATAGPVIFPTPSTWSASITGLVSGPNVITVTARDEAANATQKAVTVTFDPMATKLTINPVTTPTNSVTQTITGTMDIGAVIAITTNTGAAAGAVSYPAAGTWSSTITGLTPGDNNITVTASKPGSADAVSSVTITMDTTPPVLETSIISTNSITSSPLLGITGLTDPAVTSVTVNGQAVKTVNGAFSTVVLLTGGANTITVSAASGVGNVSTDTRTVTFDPSAPSVAITSPADGTVTNTTSVTVSGTASVTSRVSVNGTPVAMTGNAWSTTINLNNGIGIYTIEAVATDNVTGKTSSTKSTVFLSDLTRPTVALTSPIRDLTTNDPNLQVTGTSNGESLSATINGDAIPVSFLPQDGTFSISPAFTAEGKYTLAITAVDALGNSSSTFRTIIFDTTAPKLAVTSQTPTALSGTGDAGAVVTVKDKNGTVVAATTIDKGGAWSVTLTGSEAAPLNISATSAAGNNSRNGDIDGNGGKPDITDALRALRLAAKIDPTPLPNSPEMLRGDVAPIVNGVSIPDGKIDIDDVLMILMKVVGLTW